MALCLVALAVFTYASNAPALTADHALLRPGTAAPQFSLPSQDGTEVHLSDYKGKFVVLYFYPKDRTAGCTIEAHNFEKDRAAYAALHVVVLGVSLDTVESHEHFCITDSLSFKLLSDPEHKVIDGYRVPITSFGPFKFAHRVTYLIGPEGDILRSWKVDKIATHSNEVLAAVRNLEK